MQTILGSGGAIGIELAKSLKEQFKFNPTSYMDGIREVVRADYKK